MNGLKTEFSTVFLQYLEVPPFLFFYLFSFWFFFFFLSTTVFYGSPLLKGENTAHLTSRCLPRLCNFFVVYEQVFVHRDCRKYWLQCNQMDRARVRKTNPLNYFYSFITDLAMLSNLRGRVAKGQTNL